MDLTHHHLLIRARKYYTPVLCLLALSVLCSGFRAREFSCKIKKKKWDIFCWLQVVIVTIAFFSRQKKGERNQLKVRVKHWKNIIFSNFLRYWKRPNRFGNSSVFCKPYSSLILYPVIQVFYKPRKKCERYQGPWSWCWGSYYILVHTTRYFYLIWNCCYWIVWTSTQMGNMFCWSWRYSEAGQ